MDDFTPDELMGIIAEQAYEIDRLKHIIHNYYFEERAYQDQTNDYPDNMSFEIPESWKQAFREFETEAFNIDK
jgi:hypothetical protein